ncbi:hypothetical protein [Lactobacillus apis]|uniref:hypothetical protein n=1 Tax=Lactobacillus apis TaxID=303541 RepID=UPI002430BFF8|nr:hypothetical protein [Lactobacillus apis]
MSDKSRATFISGLSFSTSLATMIINPVIGAVIQKYGIINMLIAVSLITVMIIVTAYLLIMRTNKNQNKK